jgi:hypothetical protein
MKTYLGALREVFVRYKKHLGGSCLLLIGAGLFEHYTLHTISWATYMWLLMVSFVGALIAQVTDQYKKLQPRMAIRGVESSIWPFERFGYTGVGWHFTVENLGEGESLEDVCGQITSITPPPIYLPLPVPMKIKTRNWDVKETRLSPLWKEQFDLVVGPNGDPRTRQPFRVIYNVDPKEAWEDLDPTHRYRIAVRVGARNAKPTTATFETWIGADGTLKCIML